MRHQGRVVATDERRYALRSTDGSLTVEADRLVVQGAPLPTGRERAPVVTERSAITTLHLRCGLLGGTLQRELTSGYRSDVIRLPDWRPLLDDLFAHGWPVATRGLRRPR